MVSVRAACTVILFALAPVIGGHAQDSKPFPTDDEVTLLVTQADRAIQQYKRVLAEEKRLMGKTPAAVAAVDEELFLTWNMVYAALKAQPQKFNGLPGYAVLLRLNYAGKNALLCASQALSASTVFIMGDNTDKANDLVGLSQSCMNVATLLYTISENAAALFEKYILAEEALAKRGFDLAQRCAEALKKSHAETKRKQ